MEEEDIGNSFQPQPSDVLIAIMGTTGAGKSTFISNCTEEVVPIGTSLHSHTAEVRAYRLSNMPQNNVYLIDTPGFDDTEREDSDILREIVAWITKVYTENHVKLRGILYLHPITDTRMRGGTMRNLYMFKKLCGKEALKHVILVTTMWERDQPPEGDHHEEELRETPDFWGNMVKNGSRVMRLHKNNRVSAMAIIQALLEVEGTATLAIQEEMVDQNKDLHETSAGLALSNILEEKRAKLMNDLAGLAKDLAEARKAQNKRSKSTREEISVLKEDEKKKNDQIASLEKQQAELKVSLEMLHKANRILLDDLFGPPDGKGKKSHTKQKDKKHRGSDGLLRIRWKGKQGK